ncbi:unnamed protein product [Danaus chrysippus]|uniref:(African queen) hypothetical protein n=1 Tax=Danaus chrysippus TaxID=151541 RepID=A0A8J2VVQ1_9NEOP|nr:unnamed protein product [Danaus chrysippus]
MEKYLGKKYKLKSSDNFEEYLKFIEVGLLSRKLVTSLSPVSVLTKNEDGSYSLTMITPIRKVVITFQLGVEFQEDRPDGIKVSLSDERVESFASLNQKQSLQKDGDDYVLIYDNPDGQRVIKFKNGVEFDEEVTPNCISSADKTTFKMDFLGKTYIKEKDENFKEFLVSLGVAEEKVNALVSFDQKNCLKKDGDDYLMIFNNPDGEKVLKFKNGVEFNEEIAPNVNSKTTFTLDGNVLHQVQNLGLCIINIKREFSADQLIMTITTNLWDGTARRYMKPV